MPVELVGAEEPPVKGSYPPPVSECACVCPAPAAGVLPASYIDYNTKLARQQY